LHFLFDNNVFLQKSFEMKKLFFAAAMLLSTSVFAQSTWQWGIKAGGNMSLSHVELSDPTTVTIHGNIRPGVWGGGFLEYSIARPDNPFKIQLEILYSTMNSEYNMRSEVTGSAMTSANLNIQQLNVPLLLKYYILPSLSVNIGPTFNLNLAGKETKNQGSESVPLYSNQFNVFQYGASGGVSYYIKHFFIDARFNYLFGQVNYTNGGNAQHPYFSDLNGKVKFNTISLGIGYSFKIKKKPHSEN